MDKPKVVPFAPAPKIEPDPDVVEALEQLLAQAKTGQLEAIAYVAQYHGGGHDLDEFGLRDPRLTFALVCELAVVMMLEITGIAEDE